MEAADILFCVGGKKRLLSQTIAHGSSGPYSHVAIAIGDGQVAEATRRGVIASQLGDLIDEYQYIAVARCPCARRLADQRNRLIRFCQSHIQRKTPYSLIGALMSPLYEFIELRDLVKGHPLHRPSRRWPKSRNGTFCSQFVLEAFIAGGFIDEHYHALGARSPTALAEENLFELVGYLTHQVDLEPLLSRDIFWTGGG